jgi:hypothetical protein
MGPPRPWSANRASLALPQSTLPAYIMPLLFTDRDKEESCTKDEPTVAMVVSKPPFHLSTIHPNHPVF